MCAATDTYDISLAAIGIDICEQMFDGDPMEANVDEKLNFGNTFAFENFKLEKNPYEYEFSNIDATNHRKVSRENDYFTLFDFSAKWDPIPTMLCQNHNNLIKGFMGQTTAYRKDVIKSKTAIQARKNVRSLFPATSSQNFDASPSVMVSAGHLGSLPPLLGLNPITAWNCSCVTSYLRI